jgi:uncharacterized protein YqeY
MEDDLQNKMEDDLKKREKMKTTSKKMMEADLKKKDGSRPQKKRWKPTSKKMMEADLKKPKGFLSAYNQSTKINLIGCETIVNSPSF